jgi:tetratricopeptide (TPR) repeat protein
MAERVGATRVIAEAMISHGSFSPLPAEETASLLEQAAQLAHDHQLPDQESRARNNLSVYYGFGLGDFKRALEQLTIARDLAIQTAQPSMEIFYSANLVWFGMFAGRLEGAESELKRLLELGGELGEQLNSQRMAQAYQGVIWRALGRQDQAMATLREVHQAAAEVSDSGNLFITSVVIADLAVETNRELEFAQQALTRALEISYGSDAWMLGQWTRVAARLGDLPQAHQRYQQALEAWEAEPGRFAEMVLALAEAEIAWAEQRADESMAAFERAVDIADQSEMHWYRAHLRLQFAELLNELGEQERARAQLEESAATFREIGVPFYEQLARQRLQAIGP